MGTDRTWWSCALLDRHLYLRHGRCSKGTGVTRRKEKRKCKRVQSCQRTCRLHHLRYSQCLFQLWYRSWFTYGGNCQPIMESCTPHRNDKFFIPQQCNLCSAVVGLSLIHISE